MSDTEQLDEIWRDALVAAMSAEAAPVEVPTSAIAQRVATRVQRRRRRRVATRAALGGATCALVVAVAGSAIAHNTESRPVPTAPPATEHPAPVTTAPVTTAPVTTAPTVEDDCARKPFLYDFSYTGPAPAGGHSIDALEPLSMNHRTTRRGVTFGRAGVGGLQLVRRDGTVVLARQDGYVYVAGMYYDLGDLAGDGRHEFVASVYNSAELYLVADDVAVGVHDPRDVGFPLPGGDSAVPVGDQDQDGADDFALGKKIYSGRATMAARHLPAPFRTLDREMIGLLQLHLTGPPTIIEVDREELELIVDEVPPVRLAIAPKDLYQYGQVTGFAIGNRNIVELDYTERGGHHAWRWDLSKSCRGANP